MASARTSSSFDSRKNLRRNASSSSSFSSHSLSRIDPNILSKNKEKLLPHTPSDQLDCSKPSPKKKSRLEKASSIARDLSCTNPATASNARSLTKDSRLGITSSHTASIPAGTRSDIQCVLLSEVRTMLAGNHRQMQMQRETRMEGMPLQDANTGSGEQENENDWKSVQKELDDLFSKQSLERMEGVPDIDMPQLFEENNVKLHPHQIDGIRWLVHKEETNTSIPPYYKLQTSGKYFCSLDARRWRGAANQTPPPLRHSILADDMGLGKTIQAIGLILSNPPKGASGETLVYPYRKPRRRQFNESLPPMCTIVVAPVSVMSNWKMEIDKFVHQKRKNILKVELYQGRKRIETLRKVRDGKVDVLICSYQTLASDFKKKQQLEKEAAGLAKENKKITALKAESETNYMGEVEIDESMDSANDSLDYQGSERRRSRPKRNISRKVEYKDADEDENNCDENYNSDSFEDETEDDDSDDDDFSPDSDGEQEDHDIPVIFDLHFHRIILDEAHTIRNAKTHYFQSVKALEATHKLCITGTPFVNHPRDIHSFFDFLDVEPLNDIKRFNNRVVQPIEERKEVGLARLRVLMGALAIRRTKNEIHRTIQLAKKDVQIREILFDGYGEHKRISEMMYNTCRTAFLSLERISEGKFNRSASKLFGMVLRVRQACCDASLVPKEVREEVSALWEEFKQIRHMEHFSEDDGQRLFDKLADALGASKARIKMANKVDDDDIHHALVRGHASCTINDIAPDLGRSPKVQALMDAIAEMKAGEKGVIYSQWTKFLDIIERELEEEGHTFVRLDGSMSATERYQAMSKFASDGCDSLETPRFILCSLKACGTGITLTRANHVFMMDTWWNVAEENQAMDRVHRIGQNRSVRAIRFIMKDSIEQRFINVQDAKEALGKGSMERLKKEDRGKANITALKDLFEMELKTHEWEGAFVDDDDDDDGADDGADLEDFIVSDDFED